MIQLLLNILPSRILLGFFLLLQPVPQGSKKKSSLYNINSKMQFKIRYMFGKYRNMP
jgi:hypothetical protein